MAWRNVVLAPPGSPAMSFHFVVGGAVSAASRNAEAPTSDMACVHKSNSDSDSFVVASLFISNVSCICTIRSNSTFRTTAAKSAGTNPTQRSAMSRNSLGEGRWSSILLWSITSCDAKSDSKICNRVLALGGAMGISRSNRPGRRNEDGIASTRLVAATTIKRKHVGSPPELIDTLFILSNKSPSVDSMINDVDDILFEPNKASHSSKNKIVIFVLFLICCMESKK